MRLSTILIPLFALSLIAHAGDRGDEVVVTKQRDSDMEAARTKAQATLDSFFEAERAKPTGSSGFKLKVQITAGEYTEHFWVTPFTRVGNRFEGVLANEPKYVHTVKLGQTITFTRDEISDWGYVKDGKQVGSFTVCAMFNKMPKEQADYYRNNYGFVC